MIRVNARPRAWTTSPRSGARRTPATAPRAGQGRLGGSTPRPGPSHPPRPRRLSNGAGGCWWTDDPAGPRPGAASAGRAAGPGGRPSTACSAATGAGRLLGKAPAARPDGAQVLAPVGAQPVWAAGVTFAARRPPGGSAGWTPTTRSTWPTGPSSSSRRCRARPGGPGQPIGVRADSDWDVPEPELAVVADRRGEIVAYTIGDDVSSMSIEGENPSTCPRPLYAGSCCARSLPGPGGVADPAAMEITLSIERDGAELFGDSCSVADMKRSLLVATGLARPGAALGAVLLHGHLDRPPPELTLGPATGDRHHRPRPARQPGRAGRHHPRLSAPG